MVPTNQLRTSHRQKKEKFNIKHVFISLMGLPRILRLVWSASASLTIYTAIMSFIRGITPAVTATITQLLLESVLIAIKQRSFEPILLPVCLQLAVNLLDRLFTKLSTISQQLLQDRASNYVQYMVLEKSNALDLSFFEDATFYDKLREITQEAVYKPATMISQVSDLFRMAVTMFSMLFLLAHLAWWLVLVALVVPIPSFISNAMYGWKEYILARQQSPDRRRQAYFMQVMTFDQFNKEVKLFNIGDFLLKRYQELTEKLYTDNKNILIRQTVFSLLWSVITIIASGGIYFYIALQAASGRISLGQLTKYITASNQSGQSFQSVLDSLSDIYESNLFVNVLFEFMEYESHIVSPENPVPFHADASHPQCLDIEFRNVSFTYPGRKQAALKNMSFIIRTGETIALVGRNGVGKTTLVKLLTRLYDPDEGMILINGHDVKEYDIEELRKLIGVVFQDYARYQMTAQENIGIGSIDDINNRQMIVNAAQKSGVDVAIDRLSNGYDTPLGRLFEKGVELSGGEWQKIALARAFMRDAQILILDEPTSALDAQAEYDVFKRFSSLANGKTTIFISHRFSTVRLADRIFVIEDGEIIEAGTHQDLMSLDGRYAELFLLQAEAYR